MKIILLVIMTNLINNISVAQGVCVQDPISICQVEGALVFGFREKYTIVEKAEVSLIDPFNYENVIASADVEPNGRFKIMDIEPGNYILLAQSEGLITASVDIKILPKNHSKKQDEESLILIILGADFREPCGGSSITIKIESYVNNLLQNANNPRGRTQY